MHIEVPFATLYGFLLVLARVTPQCSTLFDLVRVGERDTQEGPCYICGELLG